MQYRQWQETEARMAAIKRPDLSHIPPPEKRIGAFLDKFEKGKLEAWWRLNLEMTLEPQKTHYGEDFESDLTALPGWTALDDPMRMRILNAAKQYVLQWKLVTETWLGTNTFHRPDFAGYRALHLIAIIDHDYLLAIPVEVWKKWAPVVVAFPSNKDVSFDGIRRDLARLAYQSAPDEFLNAILLLIDKENHENQYLFIHRMAEVCWDDRVAEAFMSKVKEERSNLLFCNVY
jgi:predicted NACHT family NTPase